MARIFISYRQVAPDADVAEALYELLDQQGHTVFLDRKTLEPGIDWDAEIFQALEKADVMIPLISSTYLYRGDYPEREFTTAVELLNAGKLKRLIPLNIAYDGVPPDQFCKALHRIQHVKWRGVKDTEKVVREISALIPGDEAFVKGLMPFRRSDAAAFAQLQRQHDIEEAMRLLGGAEASYLLVHGETGAGKTSFLEAGVVPRLDESGKRVLVIPPTAEIPWSEHPAGQQEVWILDQFEQRLEKLAKDTTALDNCLRNLAASQGISCQYVFVLREDRRQIFELLMAPIYRQCVNFLLLPLERAAAASVLTLLLEKAGIDYDPKFTSDLCRELEEDLPGRVRPAVLQLICQEWRATGRRFTSEEWTSQMRQKGAPTLFEKHVERMLLHRLPYQISKGQAVRCLVALTSGDAKSAPKSVSQTYSLAGVKADTAKTVLESASEWDVRIVTAELSPGGDELQYSLTHDLFAPALHSVNRRYGRRAEARRRWLLASAATLATLLVTGALVSGWYSDRSRRETDSRVYANRALREPPGRRAYELAIRGFELAPTPEVVQAGRELLTRPAPLAVVRLALGAEDLRLSRKGDRMANAYETGLNTWQSEVWRLNPPEKLADIAGRVLDLHPSQELVLVGSAEKLEIVDAHSKKAIALDTGDDELQWVRFDRNGTMIVGLTAGTVSDPPRIRRWDLTGHRSPDSKLAAEDERLFAREIAQERFTHDVAVSDLEFLDVNYEKRLVAGKGSLSTSVGKEFLSHQLVDEKVLDGEFEAYDTVRWMSTSGKLRRWYLKTGVDRYGIPSEYSLPEASAALFLPNDQIALKAKDGLLIFGIGAVVPFFRLPLGRAAFAADGTRVAIHSYEEKTVAVFDLSAASEIGSYHMSATGLTPDGSSLVLQGPEWPWRSTVVSLPAGSAEKPLSYAGWAPKAVVGGTLWASGEVALQGQNLQSGNAVYATPECEANQNMVSRSGRRALSLCKDGRLIVWQIAQRKTECVLSDHVNAFTWSPGAEVVAVGLADHSVQILHTDCEENRGVILQTTWQDRFEALLDSGGTRLAMRSGPSVLIFDAASGRQVGQPVGDDQYPISRITGSERGGLFATQGGSRENRFRIWRMSDGKRISELFDVDALGNKILEAKTALRSAFTPDEKKFVTVSFMQPNNIARVWDVKTGKLETELVGHVAKITDIFTHPNNRWVVTSGDRITLIHTLDASELLAKLKHVLAEFSPNPIPPPVVAARTASKP